VKPCNDQRKIESLINRHNEARLTCKAVADFHAHRVEVLQDYIRELNKPGFKQMRNRIIAGTTKLDYIITALNTHKEDL